MGAHERGLYEAQSLAGKCRKKDTCGSADGESAWVALFFLPFCLARCFVAYALPFFWSACACLPVCGGLCVCNGLHRSWK